MLEELLSGELLYAIISVISNTVIYSYVNNYFRSSSERKRLLDLKLANNYDTKVHLEPLAAQRLHKKLEKLSNKGG